MKKVYLFVAISLCCFYTLNGQEQPTSTQEWVAKQLDEQVRLYPQEKLHLHLDRTSFFQGESIWFKAYLTNAFLHLSATDSRYVYVELINPMGLVVNRVMVRRNSDELFYGNLPIPRDLTEGIYTLRAYTRYMENMGEDSFFRKTVEINSAVAAQIRPHYTLDYRLSEGKVDVNLYYTLGLSDKKIRPKKLQVKTPKEQMKTISMDKDTIARISYNLTAKEDQKAIYLEADDFSHYILLPTDEEDYEVSFFPEGGYLIDGSHTKVAFKAISSNGSSESISGKVYSENGELCAEIKTLHTGMGLWMMLANKNESYYLECTNSKNVKKRFELPKAVSGTYGIQASAQPRALFIGLNRPADMPIPNDLYLLIHQNGKLYFFDSFIPKEQGMAFTWDNLPTGILQVMLLDKDLNPLSERLVFSPIKADEEPVLQLLPNKEAYSTREKIAIALELTDIDEYPLDGNLSVAVTDSRDVEVDSTHTIFSTLLLTSELKGYIENPTFYFQQDNQVAHHALDLLMMTQGWRRYDIPQAIKGRYSYPNVVPEIGFTLSGMITRVGSSKPIKDSEVTILLTNNDDTYSDQVLTNEKGRFVFNQIEYPDSTNLFIQSLNTKGGEHVRLQVDELTYPVIGRLDWSKTTVSQEKKEKITSIEEAVLKKAEERYEYDYTQAILLEEAVIVGTKKETEKLKPSFYTSDFTTVIDVAKQMETRHFSKITEIFHNIPGVRFAKDSLGNTRLVIRGASSIVLESFAAIYVDNVLMEGSDQVPYSSILDMISVHDIAAVEVYKGADAAIFGIKGGTGVVNIITKKGGPVQEKPSHNKLNIMLFGFQKPVEFYSPKYETLEQKNRAPRDLRTTIYWNPNVFVGEDGKAHIEFYSADTPTVYDIVFEGLTAQGPIRKVGQVRVK